MSSTPLEAESPCDENGAEPAADDEPLLAKMDIVGDDVLDVEGDEAAERQSDRGPGAEAEHSDDGSERDGDGDTADRPYRLRRDIGTRLRRIQPVTRKRKSNVAPPVERIEYGLVTDYMTSVTKYGKHALLYVPSRTHAGHVYRLFDGGGHKNAKHLYYKCCHCWRRSNRKIWPTVVIRRSDGMIVSDPDRPAQPHICTDFDKYPMFTVGEMYAEQIFKAAMSEVRSGAAPYATLTGLITAAVESVRVNVPAEHRLDTSRLLHAYKKSKRGTFSHGLRAARMALALQAAIDEGSHCTGAVVVHQREQSYSQHWPAGHSLSVESDVDMDSVVVTGDVDDDEAAQERRHDSDGDDGGVVLLRDEPIALPIQLPQRPSVTTMAVGNQSPKRETRAAKCADTPDRKMVGRSMGRKGRARRAPSARAKRPAPTYKFDVYDECDGDGAQYGNGGQQTHFATFAAAPGFFDSALRRALQHELVGHERRIFTIEERRAAEEARHAKSLNAQEIEHREQLHRTQLHAEEKKADFDLQHTADCNVLWQERMRLENDVLDVKKQLLSRQLESATPMEHVVHTLDAFDCATAARTDPSQSGSPPAKDGAAAPASNAQRRKSDRAKRSR